MRRLLMGRPAGWMKELTGRSPMRSPGALLLRREVQQEFWRVIATGVMSEEAAAAVGVSQAVGSRWFRHGGGMPPMDLTSLKGRYLSFHEREEIAILSAQGMGIWATARRVGRSPSTISRELRRNAATRCAEARVSGVGRVVEGRVGRPAPEDSEASDERATARVCAGPALGGGSCSRWPRDRPAGPGLEGAEQASSW